MIERSFNSLVRRLRDRSDAEGNTLAYTFLAGGETPSDTLTYAEVDHRSREIAVILARVVNPGDRVLLIYPPGLDFIAAFFGCLYAGVIAVPAYPPQVARPQRSLPLLRAIAAEAGISAVLCTEVDNEKLHTLFQEAMELAQIPVLPTDYYGLEAVDAWQEPLIASDTIAFLQYTSGSTAAPKGVMVSHGNIIHNLASIHQSSAHSNPVQVSWLPTYHDMGLFSGVLFPLFIGCPSYLIPPVSFLQKPVRWLQAISRFRGTHSGGPNFAYELCAERITAEQRRELDLSSWQVAYNGAEPVRTGTLERFSATFADCGFSHNSLFPVYGLAESTVFVSGKPWSRKRVEAVPTVSELSNRDQTCPPVLLGDLAVSKLPDSNDLHTSPSLRESRRRGTSLRGGAPRPSMLAALVGPSRVSSLRLASRPSRREGEVKLHDHLEEKGRGEAHGNDSRDQGSVVTEYCTSDDVSCGVPSFETDVVIADPHFMTQMPAGEIGEIWISGPSVALGYWNRPEATQHTFQAFLAHEDRGPFLRTGDLGYLLNGELFVTGRIKDLIIVRGRKHYPQDLEQTIESCHPAIRAQCSAAFAVPSNAGDRLAIVAEVDYRRIANRERQRDESCRDSRPELQQIIEAIREAMADQHELQTHHVSLLRRGSISKTSSGKIQRHAIRDAVLNKTLDSIADWMLPNSPARPLVHPDEVTVP